MQYFTISDDNQIAKCFIAGIRFTISGLFVLSYKHLIIKSKTKLSRKSLLWIIAYGLISTTIQYSFTYIGLSNMDGSKGAIYDQLCVFFILIIGGLFFKDDSLTIQKILGCVIGFLGVFLTSTNGISLHFSMGGEGMMIFAAISQTIAYLIAKSTSKCIDAINLVGLGQLLGGIILCVISLLIGVEIEFSLVGFLIMLALALISCVAYILSILPLQFFPATEMASFNLLIPIFGIITSGIILKENIFDLKYLFAIILISIGIIITNIKFPKKDTTSSSKEDNNREP